MVWKAFDYRPTNYWFGVTRPTLKFAPTLNFLFVFVFKDKFGEGGRKKYRKITILVLHYHLWNGISISISNSFFISLSLLFLYKCYFQIKTGIIFDPCTALQTQEKKKKTLKKKQIRPTDRPTLFSNPPLLQYNKTILPNGESIRLWCKRSAVRAPLGPKTEKLSVHPAVNGYLD